MPKPSLSQQLDAAIDAMLAERARPPELDSASNPEAARFYGPGLKAHLAGKEFAALPERIGQLRAIASDLTALPRAEFRTNLQSELERTAIMGTAAKASVESRKVQPIPEGYHSLAPYLAIRGATQAIEFYKNAFGATEVLRMATPDGKIGHAEVQILDSRIMLSDEYPEFGALSPESVGGTPVEVFLSVQDVDALFAQASAAGARVTAPLKDYEYGERQASLLDPFGHKWVLSKHFADVTAEDYMRRVAEGQQGGSPDVSESAAKPLLREGFHAVIPYLTVSDGLKAIEFYKSAFGAREIESMRFADPEGRLAHGEVVVGDSLLMLAGESEEWNKRGPGKLGGTPVKIHLYVPDVDAVAASAIAAGAKVIRPVQDQFYGDRSGQIEDPFGHVWYISTHVEDVTPEEIERRAAAFSAGQTTPEQRSEQPAVAGSAIPGMREGFTAVTPYITLQRAVELVDFLKYAFGATEAYRRTGPTGGLHAGVMIGNSMVMIGSMPGLSPRDERPGAFHYYVENTDAVFQRALEAGAVAIQPPVDHEYGERGASLKDPFGNSWYIATAKGGHYIREGFHSLTPYLHPASAAKLIDFMKQAFDAEEVARYADPSGRVDHAEVRIGGAMIEMGEAHGPYQPIETGIYLYVPDVDATYRKAIEAGGISTLAPADQPRGDRLARVQDGLGTTWYIATPIKDSASSSQ